MRRTKVSEIRLIHLADIHLGYSTSLIFGEKEKFAGRYVREVDIEQAVIQLTERLIAEQPTVDVVVIAGDLFHKSAPLPRAIQHAARMVNRLIQNDIDVVIIDGNHETSSWRHIGSPTSYLREFGVHVINGVKHKVIRDELWLNSRLQGQLAVHALPYSAVLEGEFSVNPITGCLNVLVTHGRVEGLSDLNSLGLRAARIPRDVLRRGWDYVALGDWHVHFRQPLQDAPAYYAGSLEALNFGEAAKYPSRSDDENAIRGALDVRLTPGKPAVISSLVNTDQRPVLRLDSIDAADLEPEALMGKILQKLDARLSPEALVLLEVRECPLQVWEQLNHAEIDQLRRQVRRCDIRWDIQHPETEQSSEIASESSLDDQWQEFLNRIVPDEAERVWYSEQGAARIEAAREQVQGAELYAGQE
jgi:DNA repair exonuclease SbcCD nuclease subunit